ncbi:hypothetical protein [Streptomyces sp. WM6386]|uniref:hypothetical protein n=1 Tax=Streptomyces sp. WM6386 TaxID=1415558 RepID=UPI000695E215|nr:hypothetical protein [Streptomyces sp. WM6386]
MRRMWWAVGGGFAAVALTVGGWLVAADKGYPFADARACEGSDVPLEVELDVVGLPMPTGARDIHYVTHPTVGSGDVELAVAFRSTAKAMRAYLEQNKIVTSGFTHLADGRFLTGDVGTPPAYLGLCGGVPPIHAPAVLVEQQRADFGGDPETVDIALQTNPGDISTLRPTTEVLLTVTRTPGT